MDTIYHIGTDDNGRIDSFDMSNFQLVTDITDSDRAEKPGYFFNIVLGNNSALTVWGTDHGLLVEKREDVLKERRKFMKKFYKHMAKLHNKAASKYYKPAKDLKKNIKREQKLLKKIAKNTKS